MFVFELGQQLGLSKNKSIAAALVFGLASPAAVYTRFDFAQPLASLFILAAVVWILQARQGNRIFYFLSGCSAGLALLTRPETLIIPGGLLCLAAFFYPIPSGGTKVWFSRQRAGNLLLFAFPLFLGLLAVFFWNNLRFGSWFATGYAGDENQFVFDLNRNLLALIANIISPGRGVLIFFPLSLLSMVGLVRHHPPGCLVGLAADRFAGRFVDALFSLVPMGCWRILGTPLSNSTVPLPGCVVLVWSGCAEIAISKDKKFDMAGISAAWVRRCLTGYAL